MEPGTTERRTYSVAETAGMLGVTAETVRAYISLGVLHAVQPTGSGKMLVLAGSIDSLLAVHVAGQGVEQP